MKKEIAKKILQEIEQGYDLMSQKFSETRKYFWRGLEFIADYVKEGDKVLDFGCGNGRLLELFLDKNIDYLGIDISEKLIGAAKEKYPKRANSFNKISSSDSLALPDNSFNTVFSIAVFHHFPGERYRENVAKELYRVTKKDGHIIVTVWNLWQKKYIKNIFDNWINKIYLNFGSSAFIGNAGLPIQLDWNDCNMTFKDNHGKIFNRYHHAFTKCELKKLFKKAGFKIEKCEIINRRNILLVGKK